AISTSPASNSKLPTGHEPAQPSGRARPRPAPRPAAAAALASAAAVRALDRVGPRPASADRAGVRLAGDRRAARVFLGASGRRGRQYRFAESAVGPGRAAAAPTGRLATADRLSADRAGAAAAGAGAVED